MEYWYVNAREMQASGTEESLIAGMKIWGVHELGVYPYYAAHVTFDNLVMRGDFASDTSAWASHDYLATGLMVRNADIQGFSVGFLPSTWAPGGVQTIRDSFLCNAANVMLGDLWTSGVSSWMQPRIVHATNVTHAAPPNKPLVCYSFALPPLDSLATRTTNIVQRNELWVYDHNGVEGDNFRVHPKESAPGVVVPLSTDRLTAAPVAGLTNQQLWEQHGKAIAGKVSPTTAERPGIVGFVEAI